ncbi:DUF1501 domain-containing protein [Caulobacter sp. RL271]|uniref:DUF1501 domain-containing protein n=1 Tax=Caulobacter segnis TaxID=88688 RepID=A0ABY4ZN11_9CAUL|nr:DUF1501 domain-containing protein [Caulobacter segnis]USQ94193.1 DUF1501 domain-containing protein [Caulobacter segnis]
MTGLATTATYGQAWSAPATDQRFLLIFLRGGYDALSAVIPTGSDFYYESRPTLAVPRPDAGNARSALALDRDWSLHPALRDSLYPLWQQGQVAFVPFAGSEDLTRSHFETQDTIELGQPLSARRDYRSGFMGRLAQQVEGCRPIAFSAQPPITFQGHRVVPNIIISPTASYAMNDRQAALISGMYRGHRLERAIVEGLSAESRARAIAQEMAAASGGAAETSSFERAARRVGGLMKADYNIAFMDVGGWDTHVNQDNGLGQFSDKISQLGRGLSALVNTLGPEIWRNTTVVVVSEFGRTFRENGDQGTDHGHGSIYWVLGGSVKGGRLLGPQVKLTPETLNQARDLQVLTNYRSLLGGLFERLYGLDRKRLESVFPQSSPNSIGLV